MTIPDPARRALLPSPEKMVKAALRKAENNDAGDAIAHALKLRGWSLKDFSRETKRGERQLSRWLDGREHPQLDTLFAIRSFRRPLVIALAKCAGLGVRVTTTIEIDEAA